MLGHRRKLQRAIANLEGEASEKRAPLVAVVAAAPAAQHPPDTAEHRQVTVMFSDLVGSTALSTRMDQEDLREIISAYQECVAQTVGRFGGFIAKYMGDGVLIYFGYPHAFQVAAEQKPKPQTVALAAEDAEFARNACTGRAKTRRPMDSISSTTRHSRRARPTSRQSFARCRPPMRILSYCVPIR